MCGCTLTVGPYVESSSSATNASNTHSLGHAVTIQLQEYNPRTAAAGIDAAWEVGAAVDGNYSFILTTGNVVVVQRVVVSQ